MIFKKDHLLKRDTWIKKIFLPSKTFWFNNLEDYASDGSSNDAYNIIITAFWSISFAATLFGTIILTLFFLVAIFMNQMKQFIVIIGNLFLLFPFISCILIFIITTICMYRPMQKLQPMQNQTSIQKKFYISRFFSIILIWSILFFGSYSIFDTMSSNANPKGGCDICGGTVEYTISGNGEEVHKYCPIHATDWAFFHPIVTILDPPTHVSYFAHPQVGMPEFTPDDNLVYFSAWTGLYTWLFVIGFAFLLGKGYTWKGV
jgi:hypothetical protein